MIKFVNKLSKFQRSIIGQIVEQDVSRSFPRIIHAQIIRGKERFKVAIVACLIAILSLSSATVKAQTKPLPPNTPTSDIVTLRLERFLSDVDKFSPLHGTEDKDLAQSWPRSETRKVPKLDNRPETVIRRSSIPKIELEKDPFSHKNEQRFNISLYGEIHAAVNKSASTVTLFVDGALRRRLDLEPLPPVVNFLTQQTAINRASKYLSMSGIDMTDVSLTTCQISTTNVNPTLANREWSLRYDRLWNGIPFLDQHVTVGLDVKEGRLLVLGSTLNSSMPSKDTKILVDRPTAAKSAFAVVKGKGLEISRELATQLVVCHPDNYWTSSVYPTNATILENGVRLAWRTAFDISNPNDPDTYRLAFVNTDAMTNESIGGEIMTTMGRRKLGSNASEIGTLFTRAKKLTVSTLDHLGSSKSLSEPNLEFYGAIQSFSFADPRAIVHPTHVITLVDSTNQIQKYDYDSATGIIRSKTGKRSFAGAGLRKWVEHIHPLTRAVSSKPSS